MMMMRKFSKKTRQAVAGVSAAVALGLVLVAALLLPEDFMIFLNEIILAAILIAITPYAIVDYFHQGWVNKIEDQMPVLVKGISESQETGLTFMKAFEKVVDEKMVRAPLADEVKKLVFQMSWGLSFEDALRKFKERIGSPVVTRFCALVLEASRSGGQIRKVFSATSGFMEEMREMDKETSSQMRPYIVIVYAAFFVLIFTAVILLQNFFAPLEGLQNILSPATIVGLQAFREFFYRTLIVSALFGGLMAGKIGERRVAGGLKHAVIMLVVGYVIFFVFSPPNWMVT
jgi:flagellar protein FlaJ